MSKLPSSPTCPSASLTHPRRGDLPVQIYHGSMGTSLDGSMEWTNAGFLYIQFIKARERERENTYICRGIIHVLIASLLWILVGSTTHAASCSPAPESEKMFSLFWDFVQCN